MDNELDYLQSRVTLLIQRLHELQTQNQRMAEVLGQSLQENADLKLSLEDTKLKLEALIQRLPQEDE